MAQATYLKCALGLTTSATCAPPMPPLPLVQHGYQPRHPPEVGLEHRPDHHLWRLARAHMRDHVRAARLHKICSAGHSRHSMHEHATLAQGAAGRACMGARSRAWRLPQACTLALRHAGRRGCRCPAARAFPSSTPLSARRQPSRPHPKLTDPAWAAGGEHGQRALGAALQLALEPVHELKPLLHDCKVGGHQGVCIGGRRKKG